MAEKKPPKKAMSKKSMKKTKGGSFSWGAPAGGVQLPAIPSGLGNPNQCANGQH
jgi:hypothetical protein